MFIINNKKINILFSDSKHSVDTAFYRERNFSAFDLINHEPFVSVANKMSLNSLFFLHQKHSTQGHIITNQSESKQFKNFTVFGDYLITNCSNVGLGIVTADCLPVIIYDSKNNVVAAVHSGWKGAVNEILLKVFEKMKEQFNTDLNDVYAFLGPSAKACCYEVQSDFVNNLVCSNIVERNSKLFFDLSGFVKEQLLHLGVFENHIDSRVNICTICDHNFCSHRNGDLKRNISIISLKTI